MLLTWNRIAGRFEVANLPEPLVQYRVGPHTMTSIHPGVAGEMAAARFGVIQAVFGADEADEWIDTGTNGSFPSTKAGPPTSDPGK